MRAALADRHQLAREHCDDVGHPRPSGEGERQDADLQPAPFLIVRGAVTPSPPVAGKEVDGVRRQAAVARQRGCPPAPQRRHERRDGTRPRDLSRYQACDQVREHGSLFLGIELVDETLGDGTHRPLRAARDEHRVDGTARKHVERGGGVCARGQCHVLHRALGLHQLAQRHERRARGDELELDRVREHAPLVERGRSEAGGPHPRRDAGQRGEVRARAGVEGDPLGVERGELDHETQQPDRQRRDGQQDERE